MHEGLVPTPLFWNSILTYLTIFITKGAFKLYKTMEALLDLQPSLDNEMHQLEWNPNILDVPFFHVRLLDKRIRGGKVEYHVEWKGRPESERSWEKETTISSERILELEVSLATDSVS